MPSQLLSGKNKRPLCERPYGNFYRAKVARFYLGGAVVVAGLAPPAGVVGLVPVAAGLVVMGRVGAGTPDCAL